MAALHLTGFTSPAVSTVDARITAAKRAALLMYKVFSVLVGTMHASSASSSIISWLKDVHCARYVGASCLEANGKDAVFNHEQYEC